MSSSRVIRPGHCHNNNFPCYHPITRSGMGRTPGNGDTVETSANQRAEGEVLTNQRAECIHGNYGWISDNIPSYPPLSNTNMVWTVVKLLRLPRSLGHLASIKLGGVHELGSRDEWTMKLDNGGHYTSLYQTQRAIRIYRGPGHLLIGDKISCNYRVIGQRSTNDL